MSLIHAFIYILEKKCVFADFYVLLMLLETIKDNLISIHECQKGRQPFEIFTIFYQKILYNMLFVLFYLING